MRYTLPICLALFSLTGCINISTHLQPVNDKVQRVLKGEDCTPIIGGLGWGTNTIEKAMRQASPADNFDSFGGTQTIRTVRSVALTDTQFLLFGNRCIEVTGEP
jgi:hypothetical protein